MGRNTVDHTSAYFIQAHEEKVKQIALELHENISQNLYSLYTGLEYLQSGMDDQSFKSHAKEMTSLMSRTIQDVRLLSGKLYPITLQTLGLSAALRSYVKAFSTTFGMKVQVTSSGEEHEIPEPASLAIYRSCVEALVNIAKHAEIDEATFDFTWEEKSLRIDIIDEGKGFSMLESEDKKTFKGIAAIKQRVEIAGGSCLLTSVEGKGTTVSLVLPTITD